MTTITITEVHYVAACGCGHRVDSHAWPRTGETELEACQADLEENHGWHGDKCGGCANQNRAALRGDDERKIGEES
jgi:hypothetical protein